MRGPLHPEYRRTLSYAASTANKTANQTINTTPVLITNTLVTLPAKVDDIFMIGCTYSVSNEAVDMSVFIYTVVGGSALNLCYPGGDASVGGYESTDGQVFGPLIFYKVVAGDLEVATGATPGLPTGRQVSFQMQAATGSATNKTFIGSSTQRTSLWAMNMGPLAVFNV